MTCLHARLARLGRSVALALALSACASTGNPRDPLEPINRGIYHFNDGVDHLIVKPAAEIYRGVLPQFVRTGISNFFSNIGDVIVALNNLLQGKVAEAGSDVARVAVNTTVGILGFLDVATELGLEKHNEDFGQTLGYWGIGEGPYLVLPFLGPSTLRDTVGLVVDYKTNPVTYVDPNRDRNALYGLWFLSRRAELLETTRILETAALDPYEFVRDAYLQRRRNLVYDGKPPPEENDNRQPAKPQSRAPEAAPGGEEEDRGVRSILVSGEPLTPAQLEALEAKERASEPRAQANAPAARVVRVWLPTSSR
jgi:phospholipid-binding lipoprotein MlaA